MVLDPAKPYLIPERTNLLMYRGFRMVDTANKNGVPLAFSRENARIISSSGTFGLKNVDLSTWGSTLTSTEKKDNFLPFLDFIIDLIEELY